MSGGATAASKPRKREDAPRPAGDKRDRILRAAVKVFARKGFYASRVSEIARAAGVADGTIYLYFKSKDELLTSLFEDRMVRLLERMRAAAAAHPRGPDRLRAVLELQLGLLAEERDLAEVITVNLRQSTRFLKQFATRRFAEYLDLMATMVADGQRAGEFRADLSPRVVARALFGALDGVAMTWALGNGDPESLRRASAQVAELFLRGLVSPGTSSA
ncbi:MAG: TetR/AcrR family transcriptional regulator [Deltaproteobacteria bacterium]|nr:TetR/AcrR family transcriptional regulator [Deltaproteobacteria bacterium]